MTIREMGAALRERKMSCVELVQQTLADIKERDKFNSIITLMEDEALKEAAERDADFAKGTDRGPLHGVPVGLKDLFYTRGVRTTAGSLLYADFVPRFDATVVEQLREAGAIPVAKTNLHEIAYGVTSANPHYGAVLNPRDPARIPGGSSGGSASVIAAGLLPMCLGTDTGGSIRIPASYCGVVGIKPTYGRVSRTGVLPLAFTLDHVGPLGSCVEDCALTMNAIAERSDGEDFNRPALTNLSGKRVGLPKNFFFEKIAADVANTVIAKVEGMKSQGATVVEVDVPNLNDANRASLVVQMAESSAVYANCENPSLFSANAWSLLDSGKRIAGHEYVNAQRLRTIYRREFDALWQKIDVLATPATPVTAPLASESKIRIGAEEEEVRSASTRLVRAMNYLGLPALSMPCGTGANGMPVGLQLIGAARTEAKLLQIARTIE
jgi:aspartyl-tRNA(Asn)/glutamyl-tRNA(Gln) amidotransferase subunit A